MNRVLIVIDMQHDFIDGALGTPEAMDILPAVINKVRAHEGPLYATLDTHDAGYLATQEGRNLPVPHCIEGSWGHRWPEELASLEAMDCAITVSKKAFASVELAEALVELNQQTPIDHIELIGLCTDICVVSNALVLKALLPEIPISVDAACCAGVTPEKHAAALETLRSCQVNIK